MEMAILRILGRCPYQNLQKFALYRKFSFMLIAALAGCQANPALQTFAGGT